MSSATPDESGLAALTRIQRVHGQPGDLYEVIFVDQNGQPVIPLTEWYRLRASYGPVTTRETYLTCLLPFLTFLIEQGYSWNAPPNQLRTALIEFYRDRLGCLIQPRKDRGIHRFAIAPSASFALHCMISTWYYEKKVCMLL